MSFRIIGGDCIEGMRGLNDQCVQTVVTSPPYWGLRDYGVEGQLGLEPTPEEYVANLVAVFREVRRVLRDDGTLWLNLGDSYASSPPGNTTKGVSGKSTLNGIDSDRYRETLDAGHATKRSTIVSGLKPKDLVGIPWMVAFALRSDGWVLRQEIVWQKPNPMPESVTDRCTKAHEQIFMFSKAKWRGPEPGRFAHISEEDARWLALFVDTEGNITVKKTRDCLGIQIAVAGCHRGLLERAQAIVGAGNILERKGTNAPVFYWQVSNKAARDLLLRLYPHLIVKQRQARIGIYIESLVGREGQPRSPKRTELLNRLWEANKSCNSFGDPDLSWVPEPKIGGWGAGPRYFYDHEAIKEAAVAVEPGGIDGGAQRLPDGRNANGGRNYRKQDNIPSDSARRMTGFNDRYFAKPAPFSRNKRSVWTVATQPFSFQRGREHDKTYKASPDCPEHGPLADRERWQRAADGEPQAGRRYRIDSIDARRALARLDESDATNSPSNSDSRPTASARTSGKSVHTSRTCTCEESVLDHFATFPPKLIEPCILAGSPPKCCGECGAPWERVIEGGVTDSPLVTVGAKRHWRSTCDHGPDHPVRSSEVMGASSSGDGRSCSPVVLDPFAGSGTTGVVALRHGRSFIGCELNPEYAQMARHRITDDAPLLNVETA